jgi:hypothetical protein
MELLTNSKCQLILDGEAPSSGLEVIVYGDKYTVVQRESDLNYWSFDMPEDGLFQYFVLYFEEEPEDILEYIKINSEIPVAELFSICKLRNCLLTKEKDYISKFLKGCGNNGAGHCASSNEEDLSRDFLLSTIFVLEHLICTGQTVEALRILKNVSSCSLCSNNKTTSNCGCNGKNS